MWLSRLSLLTIFVFVAVGCSVETPIDCTNVSIDDCESSGCELQTGRVFEHNQVCLEETSSFGCAAQTECEAALIVGVKDGECVRFDSKCLPEGWVESVWGECGDYVDDSPLCEGSPKCEDLAISDCLSPRCSVIEGRARIGTNTPACFEMAEPLGCMPVTSQCNSAATPAIHEGVCYLFDSGCLPKGWDYSEACPSDFDGTCR